MLILVLTIPVTITLVILFLVLFVFAVKGNQFEDLETPKYSPLSDVEDNQDKNLINNVEQEKL